MSSLVEIDSYPLAVGEAPQTTFQAAGEKNLLALAWANRWLVLLGMLLGAGGAFLAVKKVTRQYTSVARIFVDISTPSLLDDGGRVMQSSKYLYTQAQLIQSTPVLSAAVEQPEIKALETFRDVENPIAFLRDEMKVMVGADDDIINVILELPNSNDAAQIVNAVVDAYVEKYAANNTEKAGDVLTIFRKDKERRDRELEECAKKLNNYLKAHPALSVQVSGNENVVVRRFSRLAEELSANEIELLQATAKFNRALQMYKSPSQRVFLLDMANADSRSQRDVELESQIRQVDQALISQRSEWGDGHPRVTLLEKSLKEMKARLAKVQTDTVQGFISKLKSDRDLLQSKRDELQRYYDSQFKLATDVSQQRNELLMLQAAYERASKACEAVDDLIKEASRKEEVKAMNVDIMDAAIPAIIPSFPSKTKFLGLGIILGGLVGFGLAWLRDLLDTRLKSVDEIAAALQLPIIGTMPQTGVGKGRAELGCIVAKEPRSQTAEAVRTLRTSLHFGLAGPESQLFLVTSPTPGDGKSTVASNLAIAMAQAGQRVLLIDADMRKPRQHQAFEVNPEQGLATVLADRRPVEEAVMKTAVAGLDLLPCGPLPSNPVELLNNGFMEEILITLRGKYDRVVIDSPPVCPVADARVLATMADCTLLVLRAERTTRRVALAARNELWQVRVKRLGVIVNAVPQRRSAAYGYGGYGGEYGGYGEKTYGYSDDVIEQPRRKSRSLPSPKPAAAAASDATEI